jgi:hypothetical protein
MVYRTFSTTSVVLVNWRKGKVAGAQMPWTANGTSKAIWSKNTVELTCYSKDELSSKTACGEWR